MRTRWQAYLGGAVTVLAMLVAMALPAVAQDPESMSEEPSLEAEAGPTPAVSEGTEVVEPEGGVVPSLTLYYGSSIAAVRGYPVRGSGYSATDRAIYSLSAYNRLCIWNRVTRVWSCNLSYWRTVYYKTFVSATSEWRIYAPLGTYWGSQTFHLFRTGSGGYNRTSFKQILY